MITPKRRRTPPPKERAEESRYRQLWRVVDGAVRDTMLHHPEYFRAHDPRAMRMSLNKRVTGALLGFAAQCAARGRSGETPAADNGAVVPPAAPRRADIASLASGICSPEGRDVEAVAPLSCGGRAA